MDVTSTSSTPATASVAKTDAAKVGGDFHMFLKMLTAQLKNQDPLNPIDSSDYAVQLATFSGVEQQVRTNDLLASLTTQLGLSGMSQLASWVGMEARAAVPVAFDGAPLTLFPAPADGAERAVLVAYDAEDREVSRQEIAVSDDPVRWTGTSETGGQAMPGTYSFRLESYAGGQLVSTDPVETFGRVAEIRQGDGGPVLVFDGGATASPSDIRALRPPPG
jgi:flagellar basal-body rod modification protein FlgD